MTTSSLVLRWVLWAWIAAVTAASLLYAPLSIGFEGLYGESPQSSRLVYFHVPIALVSFIAFMTAGVWSARYLHRRQPRHDQAAQAAIEVGLVFCVLATLSGAIWAKVQWGAYWNWDPRQISIVLALVYYAAYLTLRDAIEEPETRARIACAYGVLGLIVAPFLFFIMPRMASFSLHPKPASAEMAPTILWLVLTATAAYIALFAWMTQLRRRILTLHARMLTDAAS
ncbi:MAG: cytochrome c biogenesis protein [Acidobacteriota bacterium]